MWLRRDGLTFGAECPLGLNKFQTTSCHHLNLQRYCHLNLLHYHHFDRREEWRNHLEHTLTPRAFIYSLKPTLCPLTTKSVR